MSKKSAESVKRPKRTGTSTLVPETTECPLAVAVVDTGGSGMILSVVVAVMVAIMAPKRAVMTEVSCYNTLGGILD